MQVFPIPAFADNYIWAIADDHGHCLVVDPGDAKAVTAALAQQSLTLAGILITHHHFDHTGGVESLLAANKVPVYAPQNGRFQGYSHGVKEGDGFNLMQCSFEVLEVPGHTLDHVAFVLTEAGGQPLEPAKLFCGDTLFSGGCGRLFEGSAEQMLTSLSKLMRLPAATEVYCTHEYTLSNLAFAQAVEPDNQALQAYLDQCQQQRAQNEPTLPSSIQQEVAINPFLRWQQADVVAAVAQHAGIDGHDEAATFAALRAWKDGFRG